MEVTKIPEVIDYKYNKTEIEQKAMEDTTMAIITFRIITLLGGLRYTRHLAEDSCSTGSLSEVEDSLSSTFFDEISLEPLKHPL